jgi:Domain of unknown function (DUF1707)
MSEQPEIRVGTAERQSAQQELAEHFRLGRLDKAEFEERSASIAAARTTSELNAMFSDLPRTPAVIEHEQADKSRSSQSWRYPVIGATPLIAVALFFLLADHVDNAWLVFLLIPLVAILLGGHEYRDRGRRDRDRRTD